MARPSSRRRRRGRSNIRGRQRRVELGDEGVVVSSLCWCQARRGRKLVESATPVTALPEESTAMARLMSGAATEEGGAVERRS